MITLWIYVNTSHGIGHPDNLKVFAIGEDADAWFRQHDSEGVTFECPVIGGNDGGGMICPPVP